MSHRSASLILAWLLLPSPQWAREDKTACGTDRERARVGLHLHRQSVRSRAKAGLRRLAAPAAARTIGEIAIIEDSDGVVARLNAFDIDQKTVTFSPSAPTASKYRFQTGAGTYDAQAAANGSKIGAFSDDDTRLFTLPFPFPFYGTSYERIYVNSDGNMTFLQPDTATSERSLGRMTSGPPRIAPLFRDLDPSQSSQGVRVLAAPDRLVVTWVGVPEFQDYGIGPQQTFQVRLYPNGKIEFAYAGISTSSAVTGISPGGLQGQVAVVSFDGGSSLEYSGTVAERFGDANEVDIVTVAQKFYESFEDAYDYLVIFNNLDIQAASGALAYEVTVRNNRTGYGDIMADDGKEYGSASRLQAVMNMGPLSQYPSDPNAKVGSRGQRTGDTPLTVLAHEAGHLFLAFASVHEPGNPDSMPMLNNRNLVHWSFFFNSDASLLEGNRIRDDGSGVSPRYTTTATVEGFSELDQYLMGFRAPDEVIFPEHDLFYVGSPSNTSQLSSSLPLAGVQFNGVRRDVTMNELIQAEGRRTPDHTVSQRHFRFAVILVVASGTEPSADTIAKIEAFRKGFEEYYPKAASERAWADAKLKRSLKLSTFPAAGVVKGHIITGSIALNRPAEATMNILLTVANNVTTMLPSVTIPAGETRVEFPIGGNRAGVQELTATPSDGRYETAYARIQVRDSRSELKLALVSGDGQGAVPGVPLGQPIVFRVADINNLPYSRLPVQAAVTDGGMVSPATATSDDNGLVQFNWTPGSGASHQLNAMVEGAPESSLAVALPAAPNFAANGVVNAASFLPGLSPGGFASIFGAGLAAGLQGTAVPPYPLSLSGVQVWLSGTPLRLHYVSDGQINFLVPPDLTPGSYDLWVTTPAAVSPMVSIQVLPASPGIFFNTTTGLGAVLVAGTGQLTDARPVHAGEFLEIYGTGLGAVQPYPGNPAIQETVMKPRAFLGTSFELPVSFSGLNPVYPGLYQVNVQIPPGAPVGSQMLTIEINGVQSNQVRIQLQ